MFLHNLKYEIMTGLRKKDILFWTILFPVLLGTCFKVAFDSTYEITTKFSSVPAAVVEIKENEILRSVIESVENSDKPLLSVTYTDEGKALELLQSGEIEGIIYADDKLSLTVAGKGMAETILKSFVEQYTVQEKIITDAVTKDHTSVQAVTEALSEEINACTEIPLTDGNTDYMIQYFYNLIAMAALFGSVSGVFITINSQANLSALGARRNCSPTPKSVSLAASLVGKYLVQTVSMIVCVSYLVFVLKVDLSSRLPLVYLAAAIGGILGVSFGFCVGSIGAFSENLKLGIVNAVSLVCCFFSGLMGITDMKARISEVAPWFNNVNPAAVISDCFYCLNLYSDYDRFITKIVTMFIISAAFTLLGFVMTRRKKYASL